MLPIARVEHTNGKRVDASDLEEQRVAAYTVDRSGCVTAWSREAERMKGYAAAEVIGLSASAFYVPEDRTNAVPERELLSAIGGQEAFEGWRVRRDGSRFSAVVRIMPLYDGSGRVTSFVKVTREVPSDAGGVARRDTETRFTLREALRSIALHLRALQHVIESPGQEMPERVVAKLTVLEWRLARLEQTLREVLVPHPNRRGGGC